jgi:hypothetical protein
MTGRTLLLWLALLAAAPTAARAAAIADADLQSVTLTTASSTQPLDLDRGFGRAACDCNTSVTITVGISATAVASARAASAGNLEAWVGSQCDTVDAGRPTRCHKIGALPYGSLVAQAAFPAFGVADAVGADGTAGCDRTVASTFFILADDTGTSTAYNATKQATFKYDGQAPPAPTGVTADGGNQAALVSWQINTQAAADLDGFQLLCATAADQAPVFPNGTFTAGYQSAASQCGQAGADAGASGSPTGGLLGADPAFLCSAKVGAASNQARIDGLANDVRYQVAVVAIDHAGNASMLNAQAVQVVTPAPTQGAYDRYRDAGGQAEGGYCAVVRRAPADPLAAPLLGALGLWLWRRPRGRR